MGVALRDIIIDYRKSMPLESVSGVAAVDGFNALYQFLSIIRQSDGTPLMDSEGRVTSHLSGLFFRTVNLLEQDIRPVYVFDGVPPELKQQTIEGRRLVREKARKEWESAKKRGDILEAYKQARASSKIDEHIISSSKKLLELLGVPFIDAPSEGEAQAAFMAERGDVSFVVSQDYDSLLFGAPVLVRNLTVSGKRKVRGRTMTVMPEKLKLDEILDGLSLSRRQLVEVAVLVGTDFNEGVTGVGAKTGLKHVQKGEFGSVLAEKQPDFDPEPVISFFMKPPVKKDYSFSWKNPDYDGIVDYLCEGYDFSSERISSSLEKICGRGEQKRLDAWF